MPFDVDSKTTRMMYIFFLGGGCVYIRRGGVMRKYACVQEGVSIAEIVRTYFTNGP